MELSVARVSFSFYLRVEVLWRVLLSCVRFTVSRDNTNKNRHWVLDYNNGMNIESHETVNSSMSIVTIHYCIRFFLYYFVVSLGLRLWFLSFFVVILFSSSFGCFILFNGVLGFSSILATIHSQVEVHSLNSCTASRTFLRSVKLLLKSLFT